MLICLITDKNNTKRPQSATGLTRSMYGGTVLNNNYSVTPNNSLLASVQRFNLTPLLQLKSYSLSNSINYSMTSSTSISAEETIHSPKGVFPELICNARPGSSVSKLTTQSPNDKFYSYSSISGNINNSTSSGELNYI